MTPGLSPLRTTPPSQIGIYENDHKGRHTHPANQRSATLLPERSDHESQREKPDRHGAQTVNILHPGVHRIELLAKRLTGKRCRIPPMPLCFASKFLQINPVKIHLLHVRGRNQSAPAGRPIRTAQTRPGHTHNGAHNKQEQDGNEGGQGQLLKALHGIEEIVGLFRRMPAKPDAVVLSRFQELPVVTTARLPLQGPLHPAEFHPPRPPRPPSTPSRLQPVPPSPC